MARSTYVYVVQTVTGEVVKAFTVKHELQRWLRLQEIPGILTVTRIRDSIYADYEPHEYDMKDLLR